jgi:hypothetical protein
VGKLKIIPVGNFHIITMDFNPWRGMLVEEMEFRGNGPYFSKHLIAKFEHRKMNQSYGFLRSMSALLDGINSILTRSDEPTALK